MRLIKVAVGGEELTLLAERAAFFRNLGALVISDLHMGKINHFRKAGVAVPEAANKANTESLIKIIMECKPDRVIFIGDLFHSHYNAEWEVLGQVIKHFSTCSFELVPGNHDILSPAQYTKHNIILHPIEFALTSSIMLVHEPARRLAEGKYYLSGHIHPAVALSGKGRQSVTLPCYWFGVQQGFLPAFGVFTGFARVKPEPGDRVFAIVNGKVLPIDLPPA